MEELGLSMKMSLGPQMRFEICKIFLSMAFHWYVLLVWCDVGRDCLTVVVLQRIDYAKTKSDAAAKLDGTWRRDGRTRKVRIGQEAAEEMDVDLQEEETRGGQKATVVQDVGEPHTVLFAEGLPEATTEAMLKVLFSQFPGYIESRLVPGKPGIAFVDFETVQQAGVAITGLQGFKITAQNQMKLSYAKK